MNKQEELNCKGLAWAPAIQHPLDRMYLKKIEGIPLLPKIIGWVVDKQREETEALLTSEGVLVTHESCPEADEAFREACEALNLNRNDFRFFIKGDPSINAFTTGSEIPAIVANSGLINSFAKEELKVVLGHELGHYICGHVRCHALARYLSDAAWYTPAWLANLAIIPLIMSWSRYSELSADRAGLLAGKNFEAACSVFLKLGGFPYLKGLPQQPSRVLIEQHINYAKQTGDFSMLRRLWREFTHGLNATHPRMVERFAALDEWRDLGYYDEIACAPLEERISIAKEIGTDYLHNELNLSVVETASDYLEKDGGISRKESLPLLRKAFLRGGTLRNTILQRLVYAEMTIAKDRKRDITYSLSLFFADGGTSVRKITLPVDYSPDWDFAPDGIRSKFIETRRDELKVLIYQPQA